MGRGITEWSGTGWGTLGEVQDRSRDPPVGLRRVRDARGGQGRVRRPLGRFETCLGNLPEVWDGSGTFGEVRDWSRHSRNFQGRVKGPYRWSGMGRRTLPEV